MPNGIFLVLHFSLVLSTIVLSNSTERPIILCA